MLVKKLFLLLILIGTGLLLWQSAHYLAILPTRNTPATTVSTDSNGGISSEKSAVALTVETVAEGLFVPWSIVFTAPDRMLVSERNGSIRQIVEGKLVTEPLYRFSDVPNSGEEGLMSLVLDPSYATNKWIYAATAYQRGSELAVKVVRLTDQGTTLDEVTPIIENIPAARFHSGTDLRFGPDGKLYISTGDATDRNLAQDRSSLAGKILRLNADGSIPADNPFPGSAIYSLGHRNPQGLAFQTSTGRLYSTEHGPSVFDGPAGGDEVNHIEAGQNYGWPIVSHERSRDGLVSPLRVYTPAIAPASAEFYDSDVIPQFTGRLFYGGLRGEGLYFVKFSLDNPRQIVEDGKVEEVKVGRIRDVVTGPDGFLYFTTSNRDGRGQANEGDDKILRLRPS